jgi:hypothetical protein
MRIFHLTGSVLHYRVSLIISFAHVGQISFQNQPNAICAHVVKHLFLTMKDLDQEVKELMRSQELIEIETRIAQQASTYVNRENIEILGELLKKEIEVSGIQIETLKDQIRNNKEKLIQFGINFLREKKENQQIQGRLQTEVWLSALQSLIVFTCNT